MLTVEGTLRPWSKILVVITEDWFALSHFIPLLSELRGLADRVVVAARSSGRLDEIRALGLETRDFDLRRGSLDIRDLNEVRAALAELSGSTQEAARLRGEADKNFGLFGF